MGAEPAKERPYGEYNEEMFGLPDKHLFHAMSRSPVT